MSNLTDMIDQLVTEKTFSLEGLEAISKLKAKAKDLENSIAAMNSVNETQAKNYKACQETLEKTEGQLLALKAKESEIAKREREVFEKEKIAAVAEAKADAYRYAMETVFRPNAIREKVQKSTPIAQQSNGTSWVNHYTHEESSVREEG